MLGGIDVPSSGSVEVLGTRLETLADRALTRLRLLRLGFVFQRFHLLPVLTALENVELPMAEAGVPRTERRSRARSLLDYVGLGARAGHRPTQLSGGEMQRVAIARALANRPAVVLADEPTGELDTATGAEILALFRRLNADGTTLIVVTHDERLAAEAGRVVHMFDGRVRRLMLLLLAFRHLLVRKGRSLVLLLGFALGVAVMIVLLSVGEAMLAQSRDVALVGGGEVTVLPEGIDVEAMRTGGVTGMFFGIDRARYLTRQLLGGPRQRPLVASVAPAIESKLLYLRAHGRTVVTRAGGEIPSRARRVGAELALVGGRWDDTPADSAWIAPTAQQLYDELDHFHMPPAADSTWARVALLQRGHRPPANGGRRRC